MSGENLSFVNENFDQLHNDPDRDNQSATPPLQQQSPASNSPPRSNTPSLDQEEEDTAIPSDVDKRDEGVAVLHLSSEHTPTLAVDDGYNTFDPKSSPSPKGTSVAPSYAIATPQEEGSEHRVLPQFDHQYESIGQMNNNELRHDNTEEFDLRVSSVANV